jgi:hypothetical protein
MISPLFREHFTTARKFIFGQNGAAEILDLSAECKVLSTGSYAPPHGQNFTLRGHF